MELKLEDYYMHIYKRKRSNRTFMELKFRL